jgi:hypothetical protein
VSQTKEESEQLFLAYQSPHYKLTHMKSAIKPNQHVEDVDASGYHASEMASKDGNFIPLFKAKTATNRPSSDHLQAVVQATLRPEYHLH